MKTVGLEASQRAFAGHLRRPTVTEPPAGVEARRMRIYSELIYNNIEGFVAGAFPVLRSLLDDARWHVMVRAFVERHRCHTPYFLEIAEEFLAFLAVDAAARDALPPFALELAHYEWVELALDVSAEEIDSPGVSRDGDLMSGVPLLSPLAWPLVYRFPVHRICGEFQPVEADPQPHHLVVYRNRADKVKFLEVNALTARMLELLRSGELSGVEVCRRLADETRHPDVEALARSGAETLERLRSLDIIAGAR